MDELIVVTKELLPEHRHKKPLWEKVIKRLAVRYAKMRWRHNPLLLYPLVIDIRFGYMEYYYYRGGLMDVYTRINAFKIIMMARLQGRNVDLDPNDYHHVDVITDENDINEQLESEIKTINK